MSTMRLDTMPDLITVYQAAEWLGCSVVTVRRMIAAGKLKRVKVGRLDRVPRLALERMAKEA
ncbi:MAG: helix-turn-helix domain-containing protein [Thermoleophilia bacterium]|nr:helix-turn-helix domain-containing protein [Thermoleophilia bacterium]